MVVDNQGYLFVGEIWGDLDLPGISPSQLTISKLTDSGDLSWARQFSGSGSIDGVDDSGNAYVHVRPRGAGINESEITNLSPDCNILWTRQFDSFWSTADAHGNLYVTRWPTGELEKYGPDGDYLWTLAFTNGAPGNILSLNVDDIGNLFVSGRTLGPKGVAGPVLDVWLARVVDPVPEHSAAILLHGGAAMVAARHCRKGA